MENYDEAANQYLLNNDFIKVIECYDIKNEWERILLFIHKY